MSNGDHLSEDLLVRALDDELPRGEVIEIELHLSRCEECRRRHQELRSLSAHIESAVAGFVPEDMGEQRARLVQTLDERERGSALPGKQRLLRSFGWGMAIAATLTIGILLAPRWNHGTATGGVVTRQMQANGSFDIDGETFIALPYSNPDLPVAASHIVQMQVPVSSLAEAGIVFEPISNRVSAPDGSVLADVLLGVDGQPLGVHVVGPE